MITEKLKTEIKGTKTMDELDLLCRKNIWMICTNPELDIDIIKQRYKIISN